MSKLEKFKQYFELDKTWREAKKTKCINQSTSRWQRFLQRIGRRVQSFTQMVQEYFS